MFFLFPKMLFFISYSLSPLCLFSRFPLLLLLLADANHSISTMMMKKMFLILQQVSKCIHISWKIYIIISLWDHSTRSLFIRLNFFFMNNSQCEKRRRHSQKSLHCFYFFQIFSSVLVSIIFQEHYSFAGWIHFRIKSLRLNAIREKK